MTQQKPETAHAAAAAFCKGWLPEAPLTAEIWTAAGCADMPPALALLLALAALRLGPDHAATLMDLAAASLDDDGDAPDPAAVLAETRPEALARRFARLFAEGMGGNLDLERLLAAHACAALAIYHGGGVAELASAVESDGAAS